VRFSSGFGYDPGMNDENPYKSPVPPASVEVGRKPKAAASDAGKEYDYRPPWKGIVFCALFFGAGALVLAAKANGNDRGLIINGIIELSPGAATVFYWALAGLGVAFVAGAGVLAIDRLTLHRRIALS
jgi:hypothetical protein